MIKSNLIYLLLIALISCSYGLKKQPLPLKTQRKLASQSGGEQLPFEIFYVKKSDGTSAEWKLIDNKHWQRQTGQVQEAQELVQESSSATALCPSGMIEVTGKMIQEASVKIKGKTVAGSIEAIQRDMFCNKFIQKHFPERCQSFDKKGWQEVVKQLPKKEMSFCMDQYEYPNQAGVNPWIMITWDEGKKLCAAEGKRLCTEDEWTFACEGEEARPYPYGYERSAEKCLIDRQWRPYSPSKLSYRFGKSSGKYQAAAEELEKLWQGEPSGSRPECVSPFGVADMTGNIDEWSTKTRLGNFPSILKGGYWGPVRTRCRPSTRNHDNNHSFYQQGIRCCKNIGE